MLIYVSLCLLAAGYVHPGVCICWQVYLMLASMCIYANMFVYMVTGAC